MEVSQSQAWDTSRPSLRLNTRPSSSMSTHRDGLNYPSSPASQPNASSQSSSPQLKYRHPYAQGPKSAFSQSSNNGSTRQLSREGSMESTRPIPTVSPFLQQKLQQERKAENDKQSRAAASSRAQADKTASPDIAQNGHRLSPSGSTEMDEQRPRSKGNDHGKKKGMGLREMEKNMSDLHKQNFNLKLEVSKRREKQVELESHLAAVQSQKDQVDEVNEKLASEVEKRDKAIEEAVSMIVSLEAKVEELTKENERLKAARDRDDETFYGFDDPPRNPYLDIAKVEDERLTRVPSFISTKTDKTEMLRAVYLNTRSSVASLSPLTIRQSGTYTGVDPELASPTLSNLSRSSFPSVYGYPMEEDKIQPLELDEPLALDGLDGSDVHQTPKVQAREIKKSSSAEQPRFQNARHYQPINGMIGRQSPLQQIERLNPANARSDAGRPQSRDRTKAYPSSNLKGPLVTKAEKREALRRVFTDTAGGARLHEPALPPTPDTMSSSTLRRFKNSNDTLATQHDVQSDRNRVGAANTVEQPRVADEVSHGARLDPKPMPYDARGKYVEFTGGSYFDKRSNTNMRAHSSGSTAMRGNRAGGWASDSDDGHADTRSLESSDIWVQEGARTRRGSLDISPDLFGIPTTGAQGRWVADAMFGPNSMQTGGGTRLGQAIYDNQGLFSGSPADSSSAPPPPHRRSSLNARTGSQSQSTEEYRAGSLEATPPRRARPVRRNSETMQDREGAHTPVQQQPRSPSQPGSGRKKNHYPPITGQPQNARSGLNRIFRRSFGSGSSNNKPEPGSGPTPEMTVPRSPPTQHAGAVPPWIEDDRSGATPPPINRFPRHARMVSAEMDSTGGVIVPEKEYIHHADEGHAAVAPPRREQQPEEGAPGNSSTGSRRKWLPNFARAGSLRNKNG